MSSCTPSTASVLAQSIVSAIARRFAQIQLAQATHDADELLGEHLREAGVLGTHDLQLALRRRIVEEKVQAPALQARPPDHGCCWTSGPRTADAWR